MTDKRILHDAELSVFRKSLNGYDLASFDLPGKHQAGVHGFAVHQDRTGAAFSFSAAFFGAGKAKVLAQNVNKAAGRIQIAGNGTAIECKSDQHLPSPSFFSLMAFRMHVGSSGSMESSVPSASFTAAISAGAVGTKHASPTLLAPNGPYSSGCSIK